MTTITITAPVTSPTTTDAPIAKPSRWRAFLHAVAVGLAGSHPEAGVLVAAFREQDALRMDTSAAFAQAYSHAGPVSTLR